jgi:Flp pilus assembly protein TadG
MKQIVRLRGLARRRSLLRDQSGLAAVEFAFVSIGMFAMLSAAVDLTQMITIHRDLGRLTAEIAQALAACPNQTCRNDAILAINDRRINIAPQLESVQLGMAHFDRTNNKIDPIRGTMTYLPADINAQALAMLANGDSGVAVLATYTHKPVILGLADDWGFTTKNFRAFSVNLSSRP